MSSRMVKAVVAAAAVAAALAADQPGSKRATRLELVSDDGVEPLHAFLEEGAGKLALHAESTSLEGPVVHVTVQDATGCPADMDKVRQGDVLLLTLPAACEPNMVQLMRNAEEVGAVAVLVEADACLDTETSSVEISCGDAAPLKALKSRQMHSPAPGIPLFQVSRSDAHDIHVRDKPALRVSWDDFQPAKELSLRLTFSSGLLDSFFHERLFVETLLPAFRPHLSDMRVDFEAITGDFLRCVPSGVSECDHTDVLRCMDTPSDPRCLRDCLEGGQYCSRGQPGKATGAQVLRENVRQVCVWEALDEGERATWFKMTAMIADDCLDKLTLTGECSKIVHDKLGLDFDHTQKCVAESTRRILGERAGTHEYFEQERLLYRLPGLDVNGVALAFGHSHSTVLAYLCRALEPSARPSMCSCGVSSSGMASPAPSDEATAACMLGTQYGVASLFVQFLFLVVLVGSSVSILLLVCRRVPAANRCCRTARLEDSDETSSNRDATQTNADGAGSAQATGTDHVNVELSRV